MAYGDAVADREEFHTGDDIVGFLGDEYSANLLLVRQGSFPRSAWAHCHDLS